VFLSTLGKRVHGYSYFGNVSQNPVTNIEGSISVSILFSTLAYEQSLCLSHSSLTTFSASLICPILITLIPAKAALYVKYSVNLKYGNPESFLLSFLPLVPFFFSSSSSLPNTINESVSIARLTISSYK
jgi:hypothetical protein